MHHSVGRAVGSSLMILVPGANIGVTRKLFWDMSLGSLPWGVDIVFGKALV